jgi:thiol-disulfide isomerase/thioredoxin
MNISKKIALGLALVAGIQATAGMQNLDTLLSRAADKTSAFKLIEEIVKKYPKLVLYFGKDSCKFCKTTKAAIAQLLSSYPDVMFIMIDLGKYPFFKNGTMPKVRFHLNGIEAKITDSLTVAQLKAYLDQYYR